MASVLEPLKPLVALLRQADSPIALAERLLELATCGSTGAEISTVLAQAVADRSLVASTLEHAGVLDVAGQLATAGAMRLAQAQALIEATADDTWELVLTVPGFLRQSFDQLGQAHGDGFRPRQTGPAIAEVSTAARRRLLIAAPYLHTAFVTALSSPLKRILDAGGTAVVITRALSLNAPVRSSANVEAVALLRHVADQTGRSLTVRSWEESGLGIHFKVVVADDHLADPR